MREKVGRRERERNRQTDRQIETQRETEREVGKRAGDRETETDGHTEREMYVGGVGGYFGFIRLPNFHHFQTYSRGSSRA